MFTTKTCNSDVDCRHPFNGNYCNNRQCSTRCRESKCEFEFTGASTTSKWYSDWDAALRAYNGWGKYKGDNPGAIAAHNDYVDIIKSNYNTLRERYFAMKGTQMVASSQEQIYGYP